MCISSDLWVSETISASQDAGVSTGVGYDGGTVFGKWFAYPFLVAMPQLLWYNQGMSQQHSWSF